MDSEEAGDQLRVTTGRYPVKYRVDDYATAMKVIPSSWWLFL
jgi:hypothetical protein